jgi:hypothetical protein
MVWPVQQTLVGAQAGRAVIIHPKTALLVVQELLL